jgi:hypothetical protein
MSTYFLILPSELQIKILSNLDAVSLVSCAMVKPVSFEFLATYFEEELLTCNARAHRHAHTSTIALKTLLS